MPSQTNCQLAADALHQAFLVNLIAEIEARELLEGYDSDSGSSEGLALEDEDTSSSLDESSSDSSMDISDPELLDDDLDAAKTYLHIMGELYSQCYLAEHQDIIKSRNQLHILLHDYKEKQPDIFRSYLCITPECFDDLVLAIKDDEVFHNKSNNPQMPVAEQVAITLY